MISELPPRARRIRFVKLSPSPTLGTTSACAENTTSDKATSKAIRNYLRVRGEYRPKPGSQTACPELPPRARRIRFRPHPMALGSGTTSACAENTCSVLPRFVEVVNYLRVRGEYPLGNQKPAIWQELPPRARRIPQMSWVFYSMILKNGPNLALESEIYSRIMG